MDARYDVEIGASNTVHRPANTVAELRAIVSRANGRVSILHRPSDTVVAEGHPEDVLRTIAIVEEYGRWA